MTAYDVIAGLCIVGFLIAAISGRRGEPGTTFALLLAVCMAGLLAFSIAGAIEWWMTR